MKDDSNPSTLAQHCLPLVTYDAAFQTQLAEEVRSASPTAAFPLALMDYSALRAQIRAGCNVVTSD